jgi:hypothetical protein
MPEDCIWEMAEKGGLHLGEWQRKRLQEGGTNGLLEGEQDLM